MYDIILCTVISRDSSPPTIMGCPGSTSFTVPLGTSSMVVTWREPTATDDSGIEPSVVMSHRSGDSFPIGMTTVSYEFSDRSGNKATCSFSIIGNGWQKLLLLLETHQ